MQSVLYKVWIIIEISTSGLTPLFLKIKYYSFLSFTYALHYEYMTIFLLYIPNNNLNHLMFKYFKSHPIYFREKIKWLVLCVELKAMYETMGIPDHIKTHKNILLSFPEAPNKYFLVKSNHIFHKVVILKVNYLCIFQLKILLNWSFWNLKVLFYLLENVFWFCALSPNVEEFWFGGYWVENVFTNVILYFRFAT